MLPNLRLIAIALALVAGVATHVRAQDAVLAGRPRVGLVLSGGGARGIAHIGVLEALEREQGEAARRAAADERLRIAQELHDVVAHSLGVIAVQAGVGAHVLDDDPAEARRALEHIPPERVILAPDCGMKYLPREAAQGKLESMVEAARILRREYNA